MSAAEALDWELLEQIEPWGERRADYRAAVICWTMACCHAAKGSAQKLSDYLAMFDWDKSMETSKDPQLIFKQIVAASKATAKKQKSKGSK